MHSQESPTAAAPARNVRGTAFAVIGAVLVLSAVAGFFWYMHEQKFVYTDKAEVQAPLIRLAPQSDGVLKSVYVRQGDLVRAYDSVARVGDEILMAHTDGLTVDVQNDIGTGYKSGQAAVTMIDPRELRLVARVQEDKGLKDIYVGQKAIFTVDAFGSEEYEGTVESVSPTKLQGDVVFNISDKREEQEFEVKIAYDLVRHPELQNGMSARVWIVK